MTHGEHTADDAVAAAQAEPDQGSASRSSVDRERIAAAVLEILEAIGEDPSRDGLADTPSRVADAYAEFFGGVGQDAGVHLARPIPIEEGATSDVVLVRDIAFRSVCEHHLLPFLGTAHIAYLPDELVIGLGALPKLVDTLASRPQVQERLSEQIADTLVERLAPRGVLVVLQAAHGCVSMRGSRQLTSTTVTIASRGALADPAARAELMVLIGASADQAG
ncbi:MULTISPECIES: GTP cyclohydrolase I FolE [Plantibacter]|uniref:GTP cyclohydrolase I FolE n=1 Tax=Plantibacter TaxID=190323 RepID=UPI0025506C1D|nr:GTP cyclohydrolase I FolE [Plantibacter sp. lyk4-40-MEA-4]